MECLHVDGWLLRMIGSAQPTQANESKYPVYLCLCKGVLTLQ